MSNTPELSEELFYDMTDYQYYRTTLKLDLDETFFILDLIRKNNTLESISEVTKRSPISLKIMFFDAVG